MRGIVGTLRSECRSAVRLFANSPALAAAALLSVALGCGATLGLFAVGQSILRPPLPVARPDRLIAIFTSDARPGNTPLTSLSFPDLQDLAHANSAALEISGYLEHPAHWSPSPGQPPERVPTVFAIRNYFTLLRIAPAIGRFFSDSNGTAEAVLSYAAWQERFHGDPAILGTSMVINDTPVTVIGVAPKEFVGLRFGSRPVLWISLDPGSLMARTAVGLSLWTKRQNRWFSAFARLRGGVEAEQALAALRLSGGRLAEAYPDTNSGRSFDIVPLVQAQVPPSRLGDVRKALFALAAIVVCLLLVTVANVSLLLVGRTVSLAQQFRIRAALGARRIDILLPVLLESLLLTAVGSVVAFPLGVLVANWLQRSQQLPGAGPPGWLLPGRPEMLFGTALCLLTAVASAILPAMLALRTGAAGLLCARSAGFARPGRRITPANLLVAGQLALAVPLLAATLLAAAGTYRAQRSAAALFAAPVALAELDPTSRGYDNDRRQQLYRDILEAMREVPGIDAAALATVQPLSQDHDAVRAVLHGRPLVADHGEWLPCNAVSTQYFAVMGLPLVSGRPFSSADSANGPRVAIANQAFERRFLAGRSAVGTRLALPDEGGKSYEIVGVVQDLKYSTLWEGEQPYLYLSLAQWPSPRATLHLRGSGPQSVIPSVRARIAQVDPGLPLHNIGALDSQVRIALQQPRLLAVLAGAFALLAMVLSSIGLYGLVAHLVQQQTLEIGIRLALGSESKSIQWLYARRGLGVTMAGLTAGALACTTLARLLPFQDYAFGAEELGLCAVVVAAQLVFVAALPATVLPARRASRCNPADALRAM